MYKILKFIAVSAIFAVFSILKISFVWGSKGFMLSGFCMLAPILGVVGGLGSIGLALIFTKLWRVLLFGGATSITFGIPSLFAAWCWSLDAKTEKYFAKFFVNFLIPMLCFFIFIFHPSVSYGWWYSLYSFVPITFYFLESFKFLDKNVFVTSLKSTFIAHAIGSTIWCYFVPMTPDKWLALIPIVAIERLVFAFAMVFVYKVSHKLYYNFLRDKYSVIQLDYSGE